MINVNVCVSGSTADVTLEGLTTQTVAWDGTSFPAVVFAAFNTTSNTYPAYTVSGQIVGGNLQVTVADGGNQSVFTLTSDLGTCAS